MGIKILTMHKVLFFFVICTALSCCKRIEPMANKKIDMQVDGLYNKGDLTSGPIRMTFENGGLRYITYQGLEVIRGINFFVRDANWGTVPNTVEDTVYNSAGIGFHLNYQVKSFRDSIDFRWNCAVTANANEVAFDIAGKAHSNFKGNRLGFVLLHPNRMAGKSVEIEHSDGSKTMGIFPETISPHQPFKDIKGMHWEENGLAVNIEFSGEVFEMEDQRNWLDASYKTYCTPLERPFPVDISKGEEVHQKISITFSGRPQDDPVLVPKNQLLIGDKEYELPQIGLVANGTVLEERHIEDLKKLDLAHLRLEAKTHEGDWKNDFEKQTRQALQLGLPVELFIYSNAKEIGAHLREIITVSNFSKLDIKKVMAVDLDEISNSAGFIASFSKAVRRSLGEVPIGGGTDYYFTEVNRMRPPMDKIDYLSFSVHPQVHAFDDTSILETSSTFLDMGKSAKAISDGKPVHISPITLTGRLNPAATDANARFLTKVQRSDPRQSSELTALWTLLSIKYISEAEIDEITLFQTYGSEGILDSKKLFPVYKVLAFLAKMKEYEVLKTVSPYPQAYDGLVFQKGDEKYYVLLNLGSKEQVVKIKNRNLVLPEKGITIFDSDLNQVDLL